MTARNSRQKSASLSRRPLTLEMASNVSTSAKYGTLSPFFHVIMSSMSFEIVDAPTGPIFSWGDAIDAATVPLGEAGSADGTVAATADADDEEDDDDEDDEDDEDDDEEAAAGAAVLAASSTFSFSTSFAATPLPSSSSSSSMILRFFANVAVAGAAAAAAGGAAVSFFPPLLPPKKLRISMSLTGTEQGCG